tara:strand:+ start:523 stop:1452 length:930 start_codon:yes stop_codon:yes gene_type:complete
MKIILNTISIYLLLFFIPYQSFAKLENKIIVKIENEVITNFEIKNKILGTLILTNQEITQKNIDKQKKQALNSLTQFKLKKIELSKHNFAEDYEQVNKYLNAISSNDIEGLKKKFADNGLNFNLYLDEVKTQFKWQKFIYKKYSNEISIDENIIENEIEKIIKNQSDLEEYRLSEIEILVESEKNYKETVRNILEQINKNGFEITASRFSIASSASNSGDLGWLNAKSLSKKIYTILKKMEIGDISDPIKIQNTILFLKLNDKKISKVKNINIEELKNNLINQKTAELFRLYSRSYLSKLKNTVLIEYQ